MFTSTVQLSPTFICAILDSGPCNAQEPSTRAFHLVQTVHWSTTKTAASMTFFCMHFICSKILASCQQNNVTRVNFLSYTCISEPYLSDFIGQNSDVLLRFYNTGYAKCTSSGFYAMRKCQQSWSQLMWGYNKISTVTMVTACYS